MSYELLVNVTPQETRIALVENGSLHEVIIERASKRGLVGNIYLGKVQRVLPGMDAAFIDIGLEKAAFLHAADIYQAEQTAKETQDTPTPPIQELCQPGQHLYVQVSKDPIGTKGARVTTNLTIASRYLVLLPLDSSLGISTKIEECQERARLLEIITKLQQNCGKPYGIILRTAAEGMQQTQIERDLKFLHQFWEEVQNNDSKVLGLVYSDLPIVSRALRDLASVPLSRILIDSRETLYQVLQFSKKYLPDLTANIGHYPGERPIFDLHGIEDEIQKALHRKVPLKSGGYLIIDQTEAMTTIDVNTGGFVGHRNLEETIFRTNLEAAQAISRQLRLRNLGGIIIIDFIDMKEESHQEQLINTLAKSLENDQAKVQINDVSPLGLVEMTRKRTRESLEKTLCETCSTCHGRGFNKTAQTVCYEIFREVLRTVRQFDPSELLILGAPEVIELLLDEESSSLGGLQTFVDRPIRLQAESLYSQENFDVVIV